MHPVERLTRHWKKRVRKEEAMTDLEVRPFRIDVPEEDLDDLRRRIEATRWVSLQQSGHWRRARPG